MYDKGHELGAKAVGQVPCLCVVSPVDIAIKTRHGGVRAADINLQVDSNTRLHHHHSTSSS
jgi:hypothetical protein